MEHAYHYYAFISYNHRDEKVAKWLQSRLEHYRLSPGKIGTVRRMRHVSITIQTCITKFNFLIRINMLRTSFSLEWLIPRL